MPEPRAGLVVPGRELAAPGAWAEVFGRTAPLVVEVGFGRDTFLLDRAGEEPTVDHLGIERDPARAAAFLDARDERGLTNVAVLPTSAELALAYAFTADSVAELHVYYPDPWPKARHARHRLFQPWFVAEATRILAPDADLFVATDDDVYVEQIFDILEAGSFVNLGGPRTSRRTPFSGHRTKFEQLWRRKGRSIHHMHFRPA